MRSSSIGMPLKRTKGEIQAQACSVVHDTTKPAGGHHSGRLHEWQRDTVERNDPQSSEKQPWRAANSGSQKHAAHDLSHRAYQRWNTLQHPTRETLG